MNKYATKPYDLNKGEVNIIYNNKVKSIASNFYKKIKPQTLLSDSNISLNAISKLIFLKYGALNDYGFDYKVSKGNYQIYDFLFENQKVYENVVKEQFFDHKGCFYAQQIVKDLTEEPAVNKNYKLLENEIVNNINSSLIVLINIHLGVEAVDRLNKAFFKEANSLMSNEHIESYNKAVNEVYELVKSNINLANKGHLKTIPMLSEIVKDLEVKALLNSNNVKVGSKALFYKKEYVSILNTIKIINNLGNYYKNSKTQPIVNYEKCLDAFDEIRIRSKKALELGIDQHMFVRNDNIAMKKIEELKNTYNEYSVHSKKALNNSFKDELEINK